MISPARILTALILGAVALASGITMLNDVWTWDDLLLHALRCVLFVLACLASGLGLLLMLMLGLSLVGSRWRP